MYHRCSLEGTIVETWLRNIENKKPHIISEFLNKRTTLCDLGNMCLDWVEVGPEMGKVI